MKLFNTLTRMKETFEPLETGRVRMYNCGPTVYDYAHIGNFRSFLFADVLRRYFEFKGWKVTQVMNITDVGHMVSDADEGEDKMEFALKKLPAELRGKIKDPWALARYYEDAFFEDMTALGIQKAHHHPRATEHIPGMIKMISTLIEKDFAYVVNGNVYFSVEKFPKYGTLSGNFIDNLKPGARIEINPEKRHPADFALWKHDPKHLMKWPSPWGEGFPGWHIECSVMGMQYLGDAFDIHTGGEDNIFPHHECELAQSEAATGKRHVMFWIHARHLMVDGHKMSKSLGNFYTIRDLLAKGYDPAAIRYSLISSHYRQNMNFTLSGLDAAKSAIMRLREFKERLENSASTDHPDAERLLNDAAAAFTAAMDDDLNVSSALAAVFDMVAAMNRIEISRKQADEVLAFLKKIDRVLGVIEFGGTAALSSEEELLIKQRENARKSKNWAEADRIRKILDERGIILKDGPQGTTWKRK
jgi:cysteinyl-tRNA synthetase